MHTPGGHDVNQIHSLADLLDLHEIDLDIDRLLEERGSLPELERYKAAHGDVERLTKAKAEADAELKSADLGLDKSNGELEILAAKAAAEQNRLYAGGISARDADYLRREVDMLYAKVSSMEDEVLHFIELKEEAEQQVHKVAEELEASVAERDELKNVITEKWRAIDKVLETKEAKKAEAVKHVDDYYLELYDDLRSHRTGRIVGQLVDGVCGSCHLSLSPGEAARAVKDDPPRCIHCNAILVT
jgi:predicted  nucleic acid-binding Zn-ribbon protein